MLKIYKGTIKGKHKTYNCWVFRIGWLKFERIGFGNAFMWRLEFAHGWD